MKKILLSLALVLGGLAAQAQVWIGGQATFWRDYDANTTQFTIAPEVGYNLSDKWDIAMTIGYQHDYVTGLEVNSMIVSPYARYAFCKLGRVSLITDMGAGFATSKVDGMDDSANSWQVGFKPGLTISLNEKWGLVSHFGFLGYRDCNDESNGFNAFGDNGLGFSFANGLSFGAYYNF